MAFQKFSNIKHYSIEQIEENIVKLKKEIFNLKIQQATKQSIKNHLFKHKKNNLAKLLTLKTQIKEES
uniref:Large ribosomal subunit protein uL29c n=1 Tax=Dicranema revolutum TaxID=239144 RepID=A0A4D6WT74_9FLOR|nr:ribosomal protein L29 [Dicranema revolutum]